jgi:hypothetical protein
MSEMMGGPSRGPVVMAVTGAMLVLATLFVLLRLISRFGVVRRIAWDDYFMILAWVSITPCFHRTPADHDLSSSLLASRFQSCMAPEWGWECTTTTYPTNGNRP